MLNLENEKIISEFIIGIDEVGRGPLAGPVVSAAVHLSKNFKTDDLNDSKKMSKSKRQEIYNSIIETCNYQIGIANVLEIDKYNILQATFLSMKRAIKNLIYHLIIRYLLMVHGHSIKKIKILFQKLREILFIHLLQQHLSSQKYIGII